MLRYSETDRKNLIRKDITIYFNKLIAILQESQQKLYGLVENMAADTANTLEEIRKERESRLSNFKDVQSKLNEKVEIIPSTIQQEIEKPTLLEAVRCDVDQLLAQFQDAATERDHLKAQSTGKISITILSFFYV